MILLTRVDHRLLHGQVAVSWVQGLQANCIFVWEIMWQMILFGK